MPILDRSRWKVLEPLLDRALELTSAERARWLETLGAEDPELAAEVAALLARDALADRSGFLSRPVEMTLAGLEIGAYTLDRPLGHGGTGSVWLARRTDGRFEGLAAVKLLNLSLAGAAGQGRFRREGTTLARLTHPAIARLLDAGVTSDGQSYLVLEYVDGERIDVYADAHALERRERIQLFLQVLEAVEHAHANLVVHRDLKPSNILVTADGRVKLLDFGIAKLLDEQSAGQRTARISDDSRAFTPEYAAPEQLRGDPVSTATDVYSAAVLLYVLLCGRHPTAEGRRNPTEAMEALLDAPPAPAGLGDLDAVLERALRKDPAARYQTARAFADDLHRYLRHEPVSARPPLLAYRARRFLRRHRAALSILAGAAMLGAAYVTMVVRDRERVREALTEATASARKAEQVTDFAVGMFGTADRGPRPADSLSTREVLARGVARAHELSAQPEVEAQILDLIGRIHTEAGDYERARPVLEEALAIRRRTLGASHPDVATSLMNTARMMTLKDGADRNAIPLLREAHELRRRLFGSDDPRTMDALYALASAVHISGDYRTARPLFDEWFMRVSHQAPQLSTERAEQLSTLANIMQFSRQSARAESLARQAVVLERQLYGPAHDRVAVALSRLGSIVQDQDRSLEADSILRESIAMLRRSHPDGNPSLAHTLRDLANSLTIQERWDEAEATWRESVAMYRRYLGEGSLGYGNAVVWLGYVQLMRGHTREAEQTLRDELARWSESHPAGHPVTARAKLFLGQTLQREGRLREAEPLLREGYAAATPVGLPRRVHVRAARSLVALYDAAGRPDDAAKYREWASR